MIKLLDLQSFFFSVHKKVRPNSDKPFPKQRDLTTISDDPDGMRIPPGPRDGRTEASAAGIG
jgi:hypothetical protein